MSTEPKRGTCGWKGKIDVNYDTSVHQKPHLKYHSCIDWREGESAPAQPQEVFGYCDIPHYLGQPTGTYAVSRRPALTQQAHIVDYDICRNWRPIVKAVPPAAGTAMTAEQFYDANKQFENVPSIARKHFFEFAEAYAAHVREAAQREIEHLKELLRCDPSQMIDDAFGSRWSRTCPTCGLGTMHVNRPGEVQCDYCE